MLLLGGTSDARQIAYGLIQDKNIVATASLSKVARPPMPLGIPTRIGGWGGREQFSSWLKARNIQGIIDATHPFAAKMSQRAADVAQELHIEYLQVLRPSWRPEDYDKWTFLNNESEAASHIPKGARVFTSTGRKNLEAFDNMEGRHLFCRIHDSAPGVFPLDHGEYVVSQGPYTVDAEVALFERLKIDWLVCRNSGSSGSHAKVDAARTLGLPVAMIRRPPQPQANRAETVSEVLAWARRRT